MSDASQLPVAVDIQPGEDIAAYLQRVADANYLDFPVLTGHRRTARVWEDPDHPLLARLSSITGVAEERLRAATLRGTYPGMALGRARTGRRYAGQPATCPRGCFDTVAARLNLIVLCPNCEDLLVDRLDPGPLPAPVSLREVHHDVMTTLGATTSSRSARDRLQRLESLMAKVELALWRNWPPLFDGETQQWRTRAVRWVDRNVITGRYTIARPPSITATLLTLTWDAAADRATAEAMLDDIAIMADPWDPDPQEMPDWRNPLDARDGLLDLLENLDIQARHVPTILRLHDDPIILPEHHRTHRTAEALALTALASQAHGTPMTIAGATSLHAADSSPRAQRVAARLLDDTDALCRLAVHAERLHSAGLLDRAQARAARRRLGGAAAGCPDPGAAGVGGRTGRRGRRAQHAVVRAGAVPGAGAGCDRGARGGAGCRVCRGRGPRWVAHRCGTCRAGSWAAGGAPGAARHRATRPFSARRARAGASGCRGACGPRPSDRRAGGAVVKWATRSGVHIDRASSAWLIARFLDPGAEFVFVADLSEVPDGATPFDMRGVDFGHHGGDCTFETLLRRHDVVDPVLWRIGEIIHEADIEDEKFDAPEAPGLDALLRGLSMTQPDEEILRLTRPMFDGLYEYHRRALLGRQGHA